MPGPPGDRRVLLGVLRAGGGRYRVWAVPGYGVVAALTTTNGAAVEAARALVDARRVLGGGVWEPAAGGAGWDDDPVVFGSRLRDAYRAVVAGAGG